MGAVNRALKIVPWSYWAIPGKVPYLAIRLHVATFGRRVKRDSKGTKMVRRKSLTGKLLCMTDYRFTYACRGGHRKLYYDHEREELFFVKRGGSKRGGKRKVFRNDVLIDMILEALANGKRGLISQA